MCRAVHLAALQPPLPGEHTSRDELLQTALHLVAEAGQKGADIALLPEFLNVMGLADGDWNAAAADPALKREVAALASAHSMYVALPLLTSRDAALYNRVEIIDRRGSAVGGYDKTHLTAVERDDYGVVAGDAYPVFDLDFGRVGIMTCYDGHFPEVARILALAGAEVILFPSLQRRLSPADVELQVRARAVDNGLHIVRSSYGHGADVAWMAGMAPGKSCIVDFEGTILADAGPRVGWCSHTIDLARPRPKERSFGGQIGDARRFMREDRRPATYGSLIDPSA